MCLFVLASVCKGPRLVMDWSAVSQVNCHVFGKNCPPWGLWWQELTLYRLLVVMIGGLVPRKIRDQIEYMGFNLFAKWDAWHVMDGNVCLPSQRGYGPKCVNRVSSVGGVIFGVCFHPFILHASVKWLFTEILSLVIHRGGWPELTSCWWHFKVS